jgi:ubiquinone/menaquinone biosynthesis C-methylase UbiE
MGFRWLSDNATETEVNPRGLDVNLRAGPQMREYMAIADRIAADRPGKVLDWGCGWGQLTDLMQKRGLEVESFDVDPDLDAETTRPLEQYPQITVRLSPELRSLPYPDDSFDAALSCGVLEHVIDPDASLEELRRVLRPGGTLYVYKLPNRFSYLEKIAKAAGLYYHGKLEHDRLYTPRVARELVARHGYEVVEVRRANMLPLALTGDLANRAARRIWQLSRLLARVPGLSVLATNVELVARAPR